LKTLLFFLLFRHPMAVGKFYKKPSKGRGIWGAGGVGAGVPRAWDGWKSAGDHRRRAAENRGERELGPAFFWDIWDVNFD
jgi:hypothetical protein